MRGKALKLRKDQTVSWERPGASWCDRATWTMHVPRRVRKGGPKLICGRCGQRLDARIVSFGDDAVHGSERTGHTSWSEIKRKKREGT